MRTGKNAARSTGPRTDAGKAASSRNAFKHGGYGSKGLAIPRGLFVEDDAEVAQFLEGIVAALAPRDALEPEQAQRIAVCYLRLRRVSRFEAESLGADAPEHESLWRRASSLSTIRLRGDPRPARRSP
jgi:hypothetical protein